MRRKIVVAAVMAAVGTFNAVGILAAACLWLTFSPRAQSRPPNIVIILADDLGVNDEAWKSVAVWRQRMNAATRRPPQ